ncbi:uncharacterized protein PRCAT00005918001 [Priceomyces carsonii]|uniref:uncharacterized protein n=1 Tax=Priceomyces carsonii TaxID=28549 RepID=UPI002ED9F630|nr:unnamed protein product [Priceomyces carsonii]
MNGIQTNEGEHPEATSVHGDLADNRASALTSRGNGIQRIIDKDTSNPPEHLSEFYSFVNGKSNAPISPTRSDQTRFSLIADLKSKKQQRPPSINTFTSFSPSVLDLPSIMTSKDFHDTMHIYETLIDKAQVLSDSLMGVSNAASEFGQALENAITKCPKVPNPKVVSDGLINSAGLQYVIGSNQQILSRVIQQNFRIPLKEQLEKLAKDYEISYNSYQQEIRNKSKKLRAKELENVKLSRSKVRNLTAYKSQLLNLTSQLEEIDRMKYEYYHDVNSMIEEFNQHHLLIKTGSLVRAQLEIYEGIAKKGWSGGGLDDLLAISPDLFGFTYEHENTNDGIEMSQGSKSADADSIDKGDVHYDSGNVADHNSDISVDDPKKSSPREREDKGLSPSSARDIDESFSLPMVNQSNSLIGSRGNYSDDEQDSVILPTISRNNILNELQDHD